MAVDVATFRTRFPEFADPPNTDAIVQLSLDDAALCVDEDRWGDLYELGIYYLSAHELAIGNANRMSGGNFNAAGPKQSKTADKISYTNAVQAMAVESGDVRLASTSYGLKYLELRNKVMPPGFMVV